jgi:DNA invertase Pin-like site-specific DNA recombinase
METTPAVEQIRRTVEERIRELGPVIDELEQLHAILALLEGQEVAREGGGSSSAGLAALLSQAGLDSHPSPSRRPIRRSRAGTKPGRDGRAPQGANKKRIIEVASEDPGVTATEIAERTGVKRTVVSATINRLKKHGELESFGQGVRVPSGRRLASPAP